MPALHDFFQGPRHRRGLFPIVVPGHQQYYLILPVPIDKPAISG